MSVRLRIIDGPLEGNFTEVPLERPLVIGNSKVADIRVGAEISTRVQCRVARSGPDYQLLDLQMTNGAQINGRRVIKHCLQHGDRIQIGDVEMLFERVPASGVTTTGANVGPECILCGARVSREEVASRSDTYGDAIYCGVCLRIGPLVGRQLGHFALSSKISQGSMGAVYKASQQFTDRIVALKILLKDLTEKESMIKRFLRGASVSANMNHPNITQLYDIGEIDGLYYIAMEYVDGPTVEDVLLLQGFKNLEKVVSIAGQTAKALQHAYKNRIVHRDIKPSNILLTRNGLAKVTDFGLAKSMDEAGMSGITAAGATMGSLNYMSPEHVHEAKWADQRADIYSLGATLFHMLAGEPPYPNVDLVEKIDAIQHSPPPSLIERGVDIPAEMDAIIQKMMSKKPDERYQTPKEVVTEFRALKTVVNRHMTHV